MNGTVLLVVKIAHQFCFYITLPEQEWTECEVLLNFTATRNLDQHSVKPNVPSKGEKVWV